MPAPEALRRRLGFGLLTAYGVGVMVGAGIYVLVGAVAADAGVYAPLAFLIAGAVAAPTALSYAELSSRIPEAAGEAAFVERGLGLPGLSVVVGLAIVAVGTISAAAVLRGGVGYLATILPAPDLVAIAALGLVLTGVAILGVLESLAVAALFTLIEVAGLGLVIWAGLSAPPSADWAAALAAPQGPQLAGLAAASALAFFAFIGFEDMVNMAEEVRDPGRTVPRAILAALAATTLLYAAVTIAAVRAAPLADLGQSEQPLALVWQRGGGAASLLAPIAVAAALNGVMAQIIMASRVLYGLGRRSPRLAAFHRTHPRFGTPARATVLVGALVMAGAMTLPVADLANATSIILLAVFILINAALIALKRRAPEAPFRVGLWAPVSGLALSAGLLGAALWPYLAGR